MPAAFANTIAKGADSGEIAVTPNTVFSVLSDHPVLVYGKNATAGQAPLLGRLTHGDAKSFIAPSDKVVVKNTDSQDAKVEVWA